MARSPLSIPVVLAMAAVLLSLLTGCGAGLATSLGASGGSGSGGAESRTPELSVLTAPVPLSPALAELLGHERGARFSRPEVVKQLWAYIKARDLQDPENRRAIRVEGGLESVFQAPMDMFSMNRQLSQHLGKTDGTPPPAGL